jgi:hypothetical protein
VDSRLRGGDVARFGTSVARGAARDLRTALLCTVVVLGFFAFLLYHRAFNGVLPTAD